MAGHAQIMRWMVLRFSKHKTSSSWKKSPHLVSMMITWNKKNWKRWENGQKFDRTVLNWLFFGPHPQTRYSVVCDQTGTSSHEMDQSMWQRLGLLDFLHSQHEWFQAVLSCEKRCRIARIGIVSRLTFCRRHWRLKIHIGRNFVHFRKSDVCSNKLDVPEANCRLTQFHRVRVIHFDAGFRMDGVPALNLWDLVVVVLHSPSPFIPNPGRDPEQCDYSVRHTSKYERNWNCPRLVWERLVTSLRTQNFLTTVSLLYISDDNEAVIKMIIKGRGPAMRHVSRTQRVALDWLLDGINLDQTVQGKICGHPKPVRKLPDQRDIHSWRMESSSPIFLTQWTLLLSLATISAFELTSAQPCQCDRCRVKRREKMTNRVVAMWRTVRNLVAFAPARSLPQPSSVPISPRLERPGACCQSSDPPSLEKPGTAVFESRRHAPLSSDAGGKERTTKPGETRCTKSWVNISGTYQRFRFESELGIYKVLRSLRQISGVLENTQNQLSAEEVIWGIRMNSCMWASVYLDQERDQFQRVLLNMDGEEIQEIFSTTQNQIQGLQQTELFGLHGQLDWDQSQLECCALALDNMYKQLKAKVYVVADSVLCLGGGCPEYLRSAEAWEKERIGYFVSSPENRELDNVDGEPFVFEWKIFPRHTAAQLLQEVQKLIEHELKIHPQDFEDRIIFMSMYDHIYWTMKDNRSLCVVKHHEFLNMPESFA